MYESTQRTENSFHFGGRALLHQGVVYDDVLAPRQTIEVAGVSASPQRAKLQVSSSRVRVRASLAPVNLVQVGKGEAKLLRQLLDALSDFSGGQRGELVEKRLD